MDLRLPEYRAKIQITEEMIWTLFPHVNPKIGREKKTKHIKGFVYTFNTYANYFGVDTILETRHFITQAGHECDGFNAMEEYASGKAYESRTDLGNTKAIDGDGPFFKGRGLFQTTGRSNYDVAGDELSKLPFLTPAEQLLFKNDGLLKNPRLLIDPVWGTLAAFIYWNDKSLSALCKPDNQQVMIMRKNKRGWYKYFNSPIMCISFRVNGGWNGIDERVRIYKKISFLLK